MSPSMPRSLPFTFSDKNYLSFRRISLHIHQYEKNIATAVNRNKQSILYCNNVEFL
jgi:hypothetical protein